MTRSQVGRPIARVEGRDKVTGAARYAADRAPDRMAHAVLVTSPLAKGWISAFDATAAEQMPAVLRVLSHLAPPAIRRIERNLDPTAGQGPAEDFVPLQDAAIHYAGQIVGVVVAETLEAAKSAADALVIEYLPDGAGRTTIAEARAAAYTIPAFFGQASDQTFGDPDAALSAAPVSLEATYLTPGQHHAAMEPHGTVAEWIGEDLRVYEPTQWVGGAARGIALALDVDPARVRVLCRLVGGGFGGKVRPRMYAVLAAYAARDLGRPVKLHLSRSQVFALGGSRPETRQDLALGADQTGRLLAISHRSWSTTSTVDGYGYLETCGYASRHLYACPNIATSHLAVPVNIGQPCPMRAPGEAPGVFALESAMDELAERLAMDPLALRLLNHADVEPGRGRPWSGKHLLSCYAAGAERIGWSSRAAVPGTRREGRQLIGLGMATATYPVLQMPASARVALSADGTAVVQSATHEIGTGTLTIMAQIAADELGLDPTRVAVELGDSALPLAPGSVGAWTANSVGPAVAEAAREVRRTLILMAVSDGSSPLANLPEEWVTLSEGRLFAVGDEGRGEAVGDLLARHGLDQAVGHSTSRPSAAYATHALHTWGAQFAEVRVDADSGEIRVSRLVGAFDFGRVLNATTARNQLAGGMIFGIGMALLEQGDRDPVTGRLLNADLGGYLVPVQADVPEIDVIMINEPDEIATPGLGAKGVGEIGIVGVAAAIANAVFNATGVRVRSLPILPEAVMSATKTRRLQDDRAGDLLGHPQAKAAEKSASASALAQRSNRKR